MQKYKILDGVLGALPVFESAARLLSFTKAAKELLISQSAISRRITSMEALLGIKVFKRNHNKLELTPQGKELLSAVELGLGHLDTGISQICCQSKKETLTISCGYTFATLWLQHRMMSFRQMFNELEVRLMISDFPDELNPDKIDVRIIWDENFWPERDVRLLFAEDVFPVCSPSFLKNLSRSKRDYLPIDELSKKNLLHSYLQKCSGELDWAGWFRFHGFEYLSSDKDYYFDKYSFAVQAALNGEGIVLGFSALVDNFLARKELVQIGPTVHHRDEATFIEFASNRISQNNIQKIYDWFRWQVDNKKTE